MQNTWIERLASIGVNTFAPFFALAYYLLTGTVTFVYFDTLFVIMMKKSIVLAVLVTIPGVWIVLHIWRCHFMAMWSHPGYVSKYASRESSAYEFSDEDGDNPLVNQSVGRDLKILMKYRTTKYSTLVEHWDKTCSKCEYREGFDEEMGPD